MSSATDCVATLIDDFQKRRPIRAGSLIITVYGDSIVPRGGTVWLGSLSKLVEPIGINERLVRTSVYRLTHETWLRGEKVGRRSYYRLSGPGDAALNKPLSASITVPSPLVGPVDTGASDTATCRSTPADS